MPLIKFDVTGAAVSSRLTYAKADWHVTLHLAVPFDEHIALATGEDVGMVRFALTFKAMTAEHDRWLQKRHGKPERPVVGQMHYFDRSPAILSEAHISADAFDRIYGLVEAGRLPSTLTIEVEGLDFDWRPDGSGKVWDNRANPILHITDTSFEVPVAGLAKSCAPGQLLDLATLIRDSITLQKWTLGALVVATAVLAFRL